jgi:hypothetical protein
MPVRWKVSIVLAMALAVVVSGAPAYAADSVGVVDPGTGMWYLRSPDTAETTAFFFGDPGDTPFTGDWDCDGIDTPGLYRRSDGYVYLRDSNTQGVADRSFYFGNPGDLPVPGDFDGDGCDSVSLYRPSEQRFYVVDRLGDGDAGLGAAEREVTLGDPGDLPLAVDADGDGRDEVAVQRGSEIHLEGGGVVAGAGGRALGGDPVVWFESGRFHRGGDPVAYGRPDLVPVRGEFGILPGGDDAPPVHPAHPAVGSGSRIVYENMAQRVWLIEEDEHLAHTFPVSGRHATPAPGTYEVFSQSLWTHAGHDGITMTHMTRFARGKRYAIGFHAIPRYADGTPMQTEDQLGTFQSAGCVRLADADAVVLFEWASVGTPVIVLP